MTTITKTNLSDNYFTDMDFLDLQSYLLNNGIHPYGAVTSNIRIAGIMCRYIHFPDSLVLDQNTGTQDTTILDLLLLRYTVIQDLNDAPIELTPEQKQSIKTMINGNLSDGYTRCFTGPIPYNYTLFH